MSDAEAKIRNIVIKEAESLVKELKSTSTTYGEARQLLGTRKKSAMWNGDDNPYLLVLSEAENQLEREIEEIAIADLNEERFEIKAVGRSAPETKDRRELAQYFLSIMIERGLTVRGVEDVIALINEEIARANITSQWIS